MIRPFPFLAQPPPTMVTQALSDILPGAALALIFVLAVWHDLRSRRIPNRLIVAGTLAGLLLQTLLPAGAGLFSHPAGGAGFVAGLSGFATGLLLLLPFYAIRALGAGDVKLMATVGAFIGPAGVLGATLLSMLAGGVLALTVALWSGQLALVFGNVQQMLRSLVYGSLAGSVRMERPVVPTGKLAYALAIACGTLAQLLLAGTTEWRAFS